MYKRQEYIRVIEEEYTIDNTIEYDIYKEPNHQVQNFFQSEYYEDVYKRQINDYVQYVKSDFLAGLGFGATQQLGETTGIYMLSLIHI